MVIIMEPLSVLFSSSPPLQNHPKTQKSVFPKPHENSISKLQIPTWHQTHFPFPKESISSLALTNKNHCQNPCPLLKNSRFLQTLAKNNLSFAIVDLFTSVPCLASETIVSSSSEPVSDKINLEAILVSIDDFFNRYPFFVAGCTFIWLVVIPLTQEYLSKCKFISAIDAFRKLRDDPNAQLLDIRESKTLVSLGSPNLRSLNKGVVQVELTGEDRDGFVKKALENFPDPANTVLCLLDNFDGNSLEAAKLLVENGFKEAYAIRGGVRGKKGWLAIQEALLPPSVHIKRPKKKKKKANISQQLGVNGGLNQGTVNNKEVSSSTIVPVVESQNKSSEVADKMNSMPHVKVSAKSSSPYPNYPDLKPPTSPTPSQP